MKSRLVYPACALTLLLAFSSCQKLSSLDELKFDAGASQARRDAGGGSTAANAVTEDKPSESLVTDARKRDAGADASTTNDSSQPDNSDNSDGNKANNTQCTINDGHECDPVHQCGCASGAHCQVVGEEQRAQCKPVGTKPGWAACASNAQCPKGQGCDRGSCRAYCDKDADCEDGSCVPARAPDGKASDRFKVCWKRCETAKDGAGCAEGTSCRSLRKPDGEMGTFCAAPSDPCPTTENGMCDEPQGTGECAAGTDKKDCCERPEGQTCEVIAQCGCQADASCYYDATSQKTACSVPIAGARKRGESCEHPTDCEAGLACAVGTLNVCVSWCRKHEDCGPNSACSITSATDYGFCIDKCSRNETTSSCPEGLICASLPVPSGDYCWKPLKECEALRRDSVCQEATGLCAKGTDPEDCCVPPTSNSQCNPFDQCGCEDGNACQLASDRSFQCGRGGPKARGEACQTINECGGGSVCAGGICRNLCQLDGASCGESAHCMPLGGNDKSSFAFGVCYERCDYEDNDCPGKTACIKLSALEQYCGVPSTTCPANLIGNGVCDDTRTGGTRACELNTDPDCGVEGAP